MIENIKRGSHRHERIDEGQRDPDDEGKILLPKRLTGFLPVTATAKQRAHTKVDNANDKRNQRNSYQCGNGISVSIAKKV